MAERQAFAPALATHRFDGLGLRGNNSRPMDADHVVVPIDAALGADGAGIDVALGTVLPTFLVLVASCRLGFMDAGIAKAVAHVTSARFEHLDQTLAEQPVVRQHLAVMKDEADAAATLVADAIDATATQRVDAPLRMLQSKAIAGETALSVLDRAMRVGGGAPFRKVVGIERHFRDARAASVMAPTTDELQDFIGVAHPQLHVNAPRIVRSRAG